MRVSWKKVGVESITKCHETLLTLLSVYFIILFYVEVYLLLLVSFLSLLRVSI